MLSNRMGYEYGVPYLEPIVSICFSTRDTSYLSPVHLLLRQLAKGCNAADWLAVFRHGFSHE